MYRQLSRTRQLFINNRMTELGRSEHRYGFHGIQRRMHQPQRQGLVVLPDKPWESPVIELLSSCVLFDEDTRLFRMWYGCFERAWYEACHMEVESCYILYAESDNGIAWTKPNLGLFEHEGSRENNICLKAPGCGAMWHGVLFDPGESNPGRRYKMFAHGTVEADHGELVFFSPDGINWKPYEHNPVLYTRIDTGDSHSIMGCRDPGTGRFVAAMRPVDWYLSYPDIPYYRYDRGDPQDDKLDATFSHRRVGISFSDDFTCWSPITEVLQADLDDPPGTQMQGMTLCPYEDLYLGFVMMHYADGMNDTIDQQLAVSDDLLNWQRVGNRKPFLPTGDEGPWESGMVFAISSLPIRVGDELYFYYNAHRSTHYTEHENRLGAVGLAKLRLDGFVSLYSMDGFVVTKPFTFDGDTLTVNADASRGALSVEVLDERQAPRDGYRSEPFRGDSVCREITWQDGRKLAELQGKAVRLKFNLKDADLYSFQIN